MDHQQLISEAEATFSGCLSIMRAKNRDYASDADAFSNFRSASLVGVDPGRAILVRMLDKLARISNVIGTDAEVEDETVSDTLMDLINYSAILKAYVQGEIEVLPSEGYGEEYEVPEFQLDDGWEPPKRKRGRPRKEDK